MVHTRSSEVIHTAVLPHRRGSLSREPRRNSHTKPKDANKKSATYYDGDRRGRKNEAAASVSYFKTEANLRDESPAVICNGARKKPGSTGGRILRASEVESRGFCHGSSKHSNGFVGHETRSSSLRRHVKLVYNVSAQSEEDDEEGTAPIALRRTSRSLPLARLQEDKDAKQCDAGAASTSEQQSNEVADDAMDMYTRVKRIRRQVKRDMYGMPLREDEGKSTEEDDDDVDSSGREDEGEERIEEEEEEVEDEENADSGPRSYFLRQHKPRTQLFEAAPIEPRRKERNVFKSTPPRKNYRRYHNHKSFRSPAHRLHRKRAAFHGSSSTSSSSSSEGGSGDERRFQHRRAKSMAKSRQRCLPMNLTGDDVMGVMKERQRIGASLADIDPMYIDRSVTFECVGGLGKHLQSLKEMVVFPLLYPEVFEKFKITPPRGVLFYGPPGTGKTLMARALANECSRGDKRVAFFMRKGADCLSKWVGESERQLRLLFDQAYQMRPSIIFFDEIDGLAPVRSSRQDQIHSSIVSTLLALMDGLDSRGEVVVIGATNRIDSIDPALRRPGRFDRELLFMLPSAKARKQILKIHTKEWNPKLLDSFLEEVAEKCVGYCGADLKALCTEATLQALRRRYPQIYASEEKLQLDVSTIALAACDFERAMLRIVPAGQRSSDCPGRTLAAFIRPLLQRQLDIALLGLKTLFPIVDADVNTEIPSDSDVVDDVSITEGRIASRKRSGANSTVISAPSLRSESQQCSRAITLHRPRILLAGEAGQGQTAHLAPALLHHLEHVRTHVMDLSALYASSVRSPEESCSNVFREARRYTPSIVYIPHIDSWWHVASDTLRATLLTLVQDLEPFAAVLFMATSDEPYTELPQEVQQLFTGTMHDRECGALAAVGQVMLMRNPEEDERRAFFEDLLLRDTVRPPPRDKEAASELLEVLPKAPPPAPRRLTDGELFKLREQEETTLRELRLFLRDVLNKLARDRKFQIFTKRVDVAEVPDYYDIISKPMDLGTMMSKIDLHHYQTVSEFVSDIELICSNALYYNPDTDVAGRAIRHRACALRDTANAFIDSELDQEFEVQCKEIAEARRKRGEPSTASAPEYYYTRPLAGSHAPGLTDDQLEADNPTRYSRRIRGMEVDPERGAKMRRSSMDDAAMDVVCDAETSVASLLAEPSAAVVLELRASAEASSTPAQQPRRGRGRPPSRPRVSPQVAATQSSPVYRVHAGSGEICLTAADSGSIGATGSTVDKASASTSHSGAAAKPESCSTRQPTHGAARHESGVPETVAAASADGDCLRVFNYPLATADTLPSLCNGHVECIEEREKETCKLASPPLVCADESVQMPRDHAAATGCSSTLVMNRPAAAASESPAVSATREVGSEQATVSVSLPRLCTLLDDVVRRTRGFDVDRLEHLRAALCQKVYQYRRSRNRGQMTTELEHLVSQLTAPH